jgi:cytosine permease
MIATATKGYKALDILSKIAVPLLLVLMVGSVFKVLENNTISDIFQFTHAGEAITLGTGISMVISSFIVGAVVAPDVSRYAKTPKDTIFASILAFVIIIPLVITIGTIMAQATGTWDLVDIMLKLGWGLMALLVLLLAQWTSNDNNLYCSALGFAVVFKKLKKWQLTIISGVLGIILAIFGIYDNFIYWLLILGILIPPMGGVIIADYYFKNKTYYEIINLPRLKKLRWDSLIAWIVGSTIALITSNTSITLTTVAALDGFIIAGIVQYALCKTIYKDETPLEKNE